MSDIEDIITRGLRQSQPGNAFMDRLKQQSGRALAQGHRRRTWMKRGATTGTALLLLLAAYWGGIHTTHISLSQVSGSHQKQDVATIQVPRDVVTWLEAGRFFSRLGMEQRADNAFRQASLLADTVPYENPSASQPPRSNSIASLLTRCDRAIQPLNSIHPNPNPYAILAQSMRGQNHEN